MGEIESISFQIISTVGTAKSMYIQAIQEAKKGNFEEAKGLIDKGAKIYNDGHKVHSELIQKEASGDKFEFSLLLMHAEDQLITTETLKIVAEEFIEIYSKYNKF